MVMQSFPKVTSCGPTVLEGFRPQSHPQCDGTASTEFSRKSKRHGGDICAIFVHAGAGYHSFANEKYHLKACESATLAAYKVLKAGGSAIDAVEMAIMVLEDQEITNAGFGSNLTQDGAVECDATIVDQWGRSGAVGATSAIKNPISLARVLLDQATKPLSLRRVPPNLLVGPGATEFAVELGYPLASPTSLISLAAGERFRRWKNELNKIETDSAVSFDEGIRDDTLEITGPNASSGEVCGSGQTELVPCWMESQPHSPLGTRSDPLATVASYMKKRRRLDISMDNATDGGARETMTLHLNESEDDTNVEQKSIRSARMSLPSAPPTSAAHSPLERHRSTDSLSQLSSRLRVLEDDVQDTVGAIAVDCYGNIAAGSSSGGIGMKHRGRVGPAALVGVGTAVIPVEPHDRHKISVATVASGTGEHMATTNAASSCANRLYNPSKRNKLGASVPTNEDMAIRSFVEFDFMEHPSVRFSNSPGAIGILGVKKLNDGIEFYFAHNTDSFAVASMGSDDKQPRSVMSRNNSPGQIATGGRRLKYRRFSSSNHRDSWPHEMTNQPQSQQT